MKNFRNPRMATMFKRTKQFLLPAMETAADRDAAKSRAMALLLQASKEFIAAGCDDLAKKTHAVLSAAERTE